MIRPQSLELRKDVYARRRRCTIKGPPHQICRHFAMRPFGWGRTHSMPAQEGNAKPAQVVKISLTVVRHDSDHGLKDRHRKGSAMPNLEEAIRERAYHLWIADGQPEGRADVYWLSAQREVLTTSLEGSSETAIPHMDSVSATTKYVKKARVARSGKGKSSAAC